MLIDKDHREPQAIRIIETELKWSIKYLYIDKSN